VVRRQPADRAAAVARHGLPGTVFQGQGQ